MGFEPTDNGFANRRLSPLGYAAVISPHYRIYSGFARKITALSRFFDDRPVSRHFAPAFRGKRLEKTRHFGDNAVYRDYLSRYS